MRVFDLRIAIAIVNLRIAMPFSWIYAKIIEARNLLYDRGVFDSYHLGAKTISIGNITAGGTGKTPLVAYIVETLAERGERVCILTRGYGRKNAGRRVLVSDGEKILADPSEAGDEPFELARKLISKAIVIADADRVSAAEWAKRKFGVTAFVLDDGFQHRKVKRDVDIVCIDATDPFGGGKMLPVGRLREPVANLSRTDIVVITRANLSSELSDLRSEISELSPKSFIFEAKTEIANIISLENFDSDFVKHDAGVKKSPAFVFCGIGNPENFFKQLQLDSFSITATKTFRDHHFYMQKDIDEITKQARESGSQILLTTAKDAVKLKNLKFEMNCFVVEIKIAIDDAAKFAAML